MKTWVFQERNSKKKMKLFKKATVCFAFRIIPKVEKNTLIGPVLLVGSCLLIRPGQSKLLPFLIQLGLPLIVTQCLPQMTEGQLLDLRVQLAQCLKEWKENVLDKPNLGCWLCHTVSIHEGGNRQGVFLLLV